MSAAIHTSDRQLADRLWVSLGGRIEPIRGTGEVRYRHQHFEHPLRTNGRRGDVPAKLLTRLNQLRRLKEGCEQANLR